MAQNIVQNAFKVVEGRAVTSSFKVAEYFGKKHSDVVRAVDDLIAKNQELQVLRNFARYSETVSLNDKGATRKVPAYWMDRKGFCLLAMGFTGSKALEFKCAFYDEFDRMEKALSGESGPDFIDEAQQREIQRAVGRRAAGIGKNFSLIYGALKDRFDIPRYTCLQKRDFEAALDFIQKAPIMSREQWLQKEESERKRIEATTYRDERIPERIPAFYLTDAEAKNLLAGIYCLRYLFRPQIQAFYNTLNQMKSPLAAQFYEFFTCMHLYFIENDLSKHGYRMEDLPCYRHWLAHQPA